MTTIETIGADSIRVHIDEYIWLIEDKTNTMLCEPLNAGQARELARALIAAAERCGIQ